MGRITKSPTVGTIEVGRREMIEQIESFPPASDHIPHAGKMVVGGDGEVKLRPGASALPRWLACGGRGHGMGLWPFYICAAFCSYDVGVGPGALCSRLFRWELWAVGKGQCKGTSAHRSR